MHAKWNTGPSNRETDDGPIRMREKWNRSGTEDWLARAQADPAQSSVGPLSTCVGHNNPTDCLFGFIIEYIKHLQGYTLWVI